MSWSQQPNNFPPRRQRAMSEDGEIGEEEGEIVAPPSPTRQASFGNPPPPPPPPPSGPPPPHPRAMSLGGMPSQQPPPPAGPGGAPPPRRAGSWGPRGGGRGGHGGGPPPFARPNRLGHRHSSFSGPVGGSNLSTPPIRSQSLTSFPANRPANPNNVAAGGGNNPPPPPPPPPPPSTRPTDPRFRGFTDRRPSNTSSSLGPAAQQAVAQLSDQAAFGDGPRGPGGDRLGSYSSLAEPNDTNFRPPPEGSGPPLPPPPGFDEASREADFYEPPPPPQPDYSGSDVFRPREAFRGGMGGGGNRRANDFRPDGGGGGIRGPPPPAEESYYGPGGGASVGGGPVGPPGGGGADFRRSPAGRGRPVFGGGRGGIGPSMPAPPLGNDRPPRSFGDRALGGFSRRIDPRFKDHPPEQVRSFDGGIEEKGSFGGDRPFFHRKPPPPPPPPSAGAANAEAPGNEGFSRPWSGPPGKASPRGRKLTYFPSQPGDWGPVQPSLGDTGPTLPPDNKPKEPPALAAAAAAVASAPPAPASRPEELPPLTTAVLGDAETVRRAEQVVDTLSDLVKNPSLKAGEGAQSELPNKQLIFRALAMMDAKIKKAQKEVDDTQAGVEAAEKKETEERELAKAQAMLQAKRKEEERVRREAERQKKEAEAHEQELQSMIKDRQGTFDADAGRTLEDLEERMRAARLEEERKRRVDTSQQISAAVENFDKDISKAQKELDKSLQQQKKTETKLADVETAYQSKVEESDIKPSARGAPKMQDIVTKVLVANRQRAAEAQMCLFAQVTDDEDPDATTEALEDTLDPKESKPTSEWAQMMQQVTGFADALYTEPCESPYFDNNEKIHAEIGPVVAEYIRDKNGRLMKRWKELAEEYEYRRLLFNRELKKRNAGRKQKRSSSVAVRHSILGINKPTTTPILESTGGRQSTNPYRRARRGNEVRSEYEQEQIIAELAAKEAMEKKIAFGGSKLPRQRIQLEKDLTATYFNTFTSHKVDLMEQENEIAITNLWSDTEKCIFLDRFMQHPKDFRKIASFLRNKTTRDCVAFYYNSKQSVPYKGALKEHIMRRKRRGDYHVWDATIEAALSVGAVIDVGPSEEKPLVFLLPENDHTFYTHDLHPMKLEMFDSMEVDEAAALAYEENIDLDQAKRPGRPKKRPRDALFTLDPEKRKFLKAAESASLKLSASRASLAETDITDGSGDVTEKEFERATSTPVRRAPQKWTNAEKKVFVETLEQHGRDWELLAKAVGTKTIPQIKNFYYDYKKQSGKSKDKKPKTDMAGKARKTGEDSFVLARSESEAPSESMSADEPMTAAAAWLEQCQLQQQAGEGVLSSREREEALAMQQQRASTPESMAVAERWLQLQQLQQQQQLSQHSQTEEAARRLLQHHSHSHHQQILSNLLPWVGSTSSGLHDWGASAQQLSSAQQLESLLQLRQQQQQQQSSQNPLAGLSGSLRNSLLAGLSGGGGGLSAAALELALAQQQQQQQQQQGQSVDQLALAQRLLAFQGSGHDSSHAEALALLQRAMGGSYHGSGRSDSSQQGDPY